MFLVAPSDAGVSVEPQQLTDFGSAGRVVLSGVTLGDDRVLGGDGVADGALVGGGAAGGLAICFVLEDSRVPR